MDRNKKIIKTSALGIGMNVALVIMKATIGFLANSVAVIMDAVNNLSDALSSFITIIGTKLSGKKPDKKHPYGHGRVEYLTSVVIALIVLFAGATAMYQSILKIITPEKTSYKFYSLIVIAVAVAAKLVYGIYVKRVGKTLNASSLTASGTDSFFDAILSFSTLVAAVIAMIFEVNLEGWFGAAIALFILKAGFDILREPLASIIGIRADSELTENLKSTILGFEEVKGVYDMTLHNYGPTKLIGSAHIEVDDDMTAREIHKLSRNISVCVYQKLGIILTVGIYASGNTSPETNGVRADLEKIIENEPFVLQMHAFYLEEEQKVVSFDLIVDFNGNAEEVKNSVIEKISALHPEYKYFVVLDTDFGDR